MAWIAGGIVQAFYEKVPEMIVLEALKKLTPDLGEVVDRFVEKYGCEY